MCKLKLISPVQSFSDTKLYPAVQEQEKLPIVFVQLCSHPPLLVRHSLTSF